MSRFCAKCGMELKDNTIFCPGCGAKVGAKEQRTVKKKPGKAFLIGIVSGSGCEKPIKIYQQAISKADFDKMQDALAPGIYESEMGDILKYTTTENLNATFKKAMEEEIGDQISKFKLKVTDKEKIDSENLESVLKNGYYINEQDAKKAKAAYNLTVEASGLGNNGNLKFTVVVVKIDGKWKMAEFPILGNTNYIS